MSKSLIVLDPAGTAACCPPLTREPLSAEQAGQVAPMLKALADPVRLRLMSLIASHPGGEACVCDLNEAFDLSQPTISHHLKVLHEAGLLDRDKRGVWVYYRARTKALASLGALIGDPREAPAEVSGRA
jgi:ArsR family transcriptional regulator, arsenate/arsenite/antimonite-responsive transcriptional repressor